MFLAYLVDRTPPEGLRFDPPGSLKDIRKDQHGHIAAHPIAQAGYFFQFGFHRLLYVRVAVIQLQGVWPTREIGIPAVRKYHRRPWRPQPDVVLGFPCQVTIIATHIVVRMFLHPGMVWGGVIRNEIKHQT